MERHIEIGVPLADRAQPSDVIRPPARLAVGAPLVVDVDGCLLRTDLLWEGLFASFARQPASILATLRSAMRGKPALKRHLAGACPPAVGDLPLHPAVVDLVKRAQDDGRPVFLASGSDETLVRAVGARLGISATFGTNGEQNLVGKNKLELIRSISDRFDYVGNGAADLPIWRAADRAYAVNAGPFTRWRARRARPDLVELPGGTPAWKAWLRAIRPHQWAKNVLLFLPAMAAHLVFGIALVQQLAAGFLAFSAGASALYLLNDLIDLPHDRRHPTKRHRPFAAGDLSIPAGAVGVVVLLAISAVFTAMVGGRFWMVLLTYLALSLGYSLVIKRQAVLDVIGLASLYTMRIIAGAVMVSVPLSRWFLAFSVFFFLSLALAKRVVELRHSSGSTDVIPGRGYVAADLAILTSQGVSAGMASALVYCLYITGDEVIRLYAHSERLWLGFPILLYWLGRVWLLTARGQMHDDPVVFALRDRSSAAAFLSFLLVVLLATA